MLGMKSMKMKSILLREAAFADGTGQVSQFQVETTCSTIVYNSVLISESENRQSSLTCLMSGHV